MERKIGEIFEYNGEWYQAIDNTHGVMCSGCTFVNEYNDCEADNSVVGSCGCKEDTPLIFKKLEKVGEPYERYESMFQEYRVFEVPIFTDPDYATIREFGNDLKISIEIKQHKEYIEEEKLDPHIEKVIDEATQKLGDEISRQLNENLNKQRMKPFDLQKAKSGKPVCTRDGRKARIICFDAEGNKPLIVLSKIDGKEVILRYTEKGQSDNFHSPTPREDDLMMLPEKKEGWVNIYDMSTINSKKLPHMSPIYPTKEKALEGATGHVIDTVKLTWEE